MAGLLALILYVVAAFDHPFVGELRVRPEAFELALTILER